MNVKYKKYSKMYVFFKIQTPTKLLSDYVDLRNFGQLYGKML